MNLGSNQKYSGGSQINEENGQTANSISGEIIQLYCHETVFPVNEVSFEDQDEILLRIPVIASQGSMESYETTRTNSNVASIIKPDN